LSILHLSLSFALSVSLSLSPSQTDFLLLASSSSLFWLPLFHKSCLWELPSLPLCLFTPSLPKVEIPRRKAASYAFSDLLMLLVLVVLNSGYLNFLFCFWLFDCLFLVWLLFGFFVFGWGMKVVRNEK
jgi:hypothetical protein